MASSLQDLFSAESPPRPPPPRSPSPASSFGTPAGPSRRAGAGDNPLFFSPGSSVGGTPVRSRGLKRPLARDAAVFPRSPEYGGFDDVIDDLDLDLAPRLPVAAASRFDDPLAGLDDPLAGLGLPGADGEERPVKRRMPIAKVDSDRLLGEHGFPALMKIAKKFKVKGKGHEATDLGRLLDVYQLWAHQMFPKGDFAHTVGRIEAVCRTRRMESAIKGYRDAFYPPPPSPPPARSVTPGVNEVDVEAHSLHRPRTPPLFDDVDPDIEDMMALEEMERDQANSHSSHPPIAVDEGAPPMLDEEDDWEGLYN